MGMPAAARISDCMSILDFAAIPPNVSDVAKVHLPETLGCALGTGGATVAERAGGAERASVIGPPYGVPAENAALANGMLGHALDYDDTHLRARSHVSSVLCPTALPVARLTEAALDGPERVLEGWYRLYTTCLGADPERIGAELEHAVLDLDCAPDWVGLSAGLRAVWAGR